MYGTSLRSQLQHGKAYKNYMEENFRMKIFLENKKLIAEHNQQYALGKTSFRVAMNHFGDMVSLSLCIGVQLSNKNIPWNSY